MCDYSLGEIRSRLAVKDETLVLHCFPTSTKGFACPEDVHVTLPSCQPRTLWGKIAEFCRALNRPISKAPAVCVPPGASLILSGIPFHLQKRWNVGEEEPVTFVQTTMQVNVHRDGVCFRNGIQVLLQQLNEGVFAKVVSLGSEELENVEHNAGAEQHEVVAR